MSEEALLDSLDEALAAGLIRVADGGPGAGTYDFAHAIVRHTLYHEMNPDRRARLHRRIAETLERGAAGRPAAAGEIATQYHASAPMPGGERGVPYALAAAAQARAGAAHERAVTFLRMARDLSVGGPSVLRANVLRQLAGRQTARAPVGQAHASARPGWRSSRAGSSTRRGGWATTRRPSPWPEPASTATATRYGSVSGQAEALAQLATVRLVLGDLLLAQQTVERAQELVGRLGAVHRLHPILEAALPSCVAYYLDGGWDAVARSALGFAGSALAGRRSIHALVMAVMAALSFARAGEVSEATRLLALATPTLSRTPPTTHQHNVAVHGGASAVREIGAREFAASYREMALDLVAAGMGDTVLGSSMLTVARMAALLGEAADSEVYFARARALLDANGQRPLRAIGDYDEALALRRLRLAESVRSAALLDSAASGFRALGMQGWLARARRLQEQATATSQGETGVASGYPAGLTAREVEVLRLPAGGRSNKEIAQALVVSVPTAERHVANVYAKIGARGRVEATTFALHNGLAPAPEARHEPPPTRG